MAEHFNIKEENSIKSFFNEASWQKLTVLEKKRLINIRRNYDVLESLGFKPKRPEFMMKKKNLNDLRTEQSSKKGSHTSRAYDPKEFEPMMERLKELNEARKKGNVAVSSEKKRLLEDMAEEMCQLDWSDHRLNVGAQRRAKMSRLLSWSEESMRSLKEQPEVPEKERDKEAETVPAVVAEPEVSSGRSSRPRRHLPKICYREEELSSEDDYLYCEDCGQSYEGHCPVHGPMILVQDTKVLPGKNPDRAKQTCPSLLSVCQSGIKGAGLGVWTERGLDKGLVFGPYKGKIVQNRKEAEVGGYAWVIRRGGRVVHFIEGLDPSTSNWLRYVNCALGEEHQNLIAFQYLGQIFYRTYKPVLPYTELLVWYGADYARDLGIQVARGAAGASGSSTSRSGAPHLSRELNLVRDVEGAFSSDVGRSIRARRLAALQTTAERRPKLPGVAIPLDTEEGKRKVWTCFRCCVVFDALWKFRQHQKSSHATPQETDKSEAARRAERSVGRHEEESALNDQTPTEIQPCESKSTGSKSRKERRKYECPHCEYRARLSHHLKNHVSAIHSGEKPHQCPQCHYRTAISVNLQRHVADVHRGERPHRCPFCEYRSATSFVLKQHVAASHRGQRDHRCPHCEFRARTSSNLKQHVSTTHLNQKPFKCPHCEHRAASSSNLKRHVSATHLNQKPFKCPHCDYRSAQSSGLKRHVSETHLKQKSFKCLQCEHRSAQLANLKRHVRTVHGQPNPAPRNSKSDGPCE